jgi:hypothetical protein
MYHHKNLPTIHQAPDTWETCEQFSDDDGYVWMRGIGWSNGRKVNFVYRLR